MTNRKETQTEYIKEVINAEWDLSLSEMQEVDKLLTKLQKRV